MYKKREVGSSAIALGAVPAVYPVATVLPATVVITVPGRAVKAPVEVFSAKPSTAAFGDTSWSSTYTKLLKLLVVTLTGLLPTFTFVAVPSELSALIGKIVTPPGPGVVDEYPVWYV